MAHPTAEAVEQSAESGSHLDDILKFAGEEPDQPLPEEEEEEPETDEGEEPEAEEEEEVPEEEEGEAEEKRHCPTCQMELIKVNIQKGANAGKKAWSCPAKKGGKFLNHVFEVID
jgi:hypothetical protein